MKILLLALSFSLNAFAEVKLDAPAPNFSEIDHAGKTHTLEANKGKWVVLEWYNESCPFVKKHYGTKNMQNLQKTYTDKGVVWYTVATSAEGKQGYVAPKEAEQKRKAAGMHSTALLLDADGTMGKAYSAKTTPHMFIINPEGKVAYAGAIDSNDSSDAKTIASATNYVSAALDAGMAGKPIDQKSTKPYGCSVKYP